MSITKGSVFERTMRWAQITLTEDDPAHFDPDFWLDYFKRIHAEGAVISTGGYIAYHPTKIPLHHRSDWLGDSDPFGYLVSGCRRMDMAVIARSDPHAARRDVLEAHPDWIAVNADGAKRRHWAMPDRWITCPLGPYNFEFMTEVHREIVEMYGVDAIFSNRWAGHGICYCDHCTAGFRAACGLDLPRSNDLRDPEWIAYLAWREDRLFELCTVWDRAIKGARPESWYIPNSGGGALSGLDMKRLGELVPILFADRQARRGTLPPWGNGKNAKEFRGALGQKPIGCVFSVGVEEEYRWKDSVQSPEEIRVWAAEGIAQGMRPWFTKFCATPHDHRWFPVVESLYRWHDRVASYLRNTENLARVAIVYSQRSATRYGGAQAQQWVEDPILGAYQALLEARTPFEMLHDSYLDAEHLARFKTLVLPNIAVLSTAQCAEIARFVRQGGGLVATFETSLYDESGRRPEGLGLGDLFGVRVSGEVEGPMRNSYLRVHADEAPEEIRRALPGAERIINGVHRLPVEATAGLKVRPITLVPAYPDLPMEEVYPRVADSGHPELILRELGKGRAVYFPWDIDRTFWELLHADHGQLLAAAVAWATNERRPCLVRGKGMVDLALWRQEGSMTLHIVNLTNPMTMRGAYREIYPIGEQEVEVVLPPEAGVARVHALSAERDLPYTISDGVLSTTVPAVELHEILAIDFN